MNKTDVLTGRIVQRVLDQKLSLGVSDLPIIHGVSDECDINSLISNLFMLFPSCSITLKRLPFGYHLEIKD